jgi:hypothetical protein
MCSRHTHNIYTAQFIQSIYAIQVVRPSNYCFNTTSASVTVSLTVYSAGLSADRAGGTVVKGDNAEIVDSAGAGVMALTETDHADENSSPRSWCFSVAANNSNF